MSLLAAALHDAAAANAPSILPRVTHLDRVRATRAILHARKVLPAPVARVVAEQILWDTDASNALVDRGRAAALVEAVLSLNQP